LAEGENKLSEIFDIYKAKANDLQKAFIILIGFGLFFFFMILLPYFSLKYDAMNLSQIEWLTGNISRIISSVDSVVNESQTMTSNLQSYVNTRDKYNVDVQNYNSQVNRIQYLIENLSMTVANPVIQNLVQDLDIFPNCKKYSFGTDDWRKCNVDSKLNSTTKPLTDAFNAQFKLINASKDKIEQEIRETMGLMRNIDVQIKRPLDISSYDTIVDNYHIISTNINSTFKNVTSSLLPVIEEKIVYTLPVLDLSRLKQIRVNLDQLVTEIELRGTAINEGIQKLASRFDQFESPLGKIPLGFSEAIAVFPLLIAIGFFIYSYLLLQMIGLRKELEARYPANDPVLKLKVDRYVSFLAPIWFDPSEKRKQFPQLLILFIPLLLFLACFFMVIDILFLFDDPHSRSDDVFAAATTINKWIFIVLDGSGFVLIVYSYIKLLLIDNVPKKRIKKYTSDGKLSLG
jgi:hypothetical protein